MLDDFAKVVVINLPERSDRRREMQAQLRRIGLLRAEFFAAYRYANPEPFHRTGSRGNYMSQLQVLRSAIGLPSILLMQDDLNFVRDLDRRVRLIAHLPNDWAVFYAGYTDYQPATRPPGLWRVEPLKELIGAHFFAVNGPVIPRLVEALDAYLSRPRDHPDGGPMPMDGALNVFRRQNPSLPVYAAVPPLGYQRASRSDCDAPKWFDHTPLIAEMVAQLRRAKNLVLRR